MVFLGQRDQQSLVLAHNTANSRLTLRRQIIIFFIGILNKSHALSFCLGVQNQFPHKLVFLLQSGTRCRRSNRVLHVLVQDDHAILYILPIEFSRKRVGAPSIMPFVQVALQLLRLLSSLQVDNEQRDQTGVAIVRLASKEQSIANNTCVLVAIFVVVVVDVS